MSFAGEMSVENREVQNEEDEAVLSAVVGEGEMLESREQVFMLVVLCCKTVWRLKLSWHSCGFGGGRGMAVLVGRNALIIFQRLLNNSNRDPRLILRISQSLIIFTRNRKECFNSGIDLSADFS